MNVTGIIGGSGLYSLFDKSAVTFEKIETPFGNPSDEFAKGEINGHKIIFLPRHGKDHSLLPHEVNYQANIYGMKKLGVTQILSVSAVGSLKEEYKPRDVVLVDQFFDRTSKRPQTFFGNGFAAHIAFGDPVCPDLRKKILEVSDNLPGRIHPEGTYVNMEGPLFSTRAESFFYRKQGFDIIGMTNLSEARLAREAEICYVSLAFVTDYDCWHEETDDVTTDSVIAILKDNAENAKKIVSEVIDSLSKREINCTCQDALKTAMITPYSKIPEQTKLNLNEILKKYSQ